MVFGAMNAKAHIRRKEQSKVRDVRQTNISWPTKVKIYWYFFHVRLLVKVHRAERTGVKHRVHSK
jgi:hypothetical protein